MATTIEDIEKAIALTAHEKVKTSLLLSKTKEVEKGDKDGIDSSIPSVRDEISGSKSPLVNKSDGGVVSSPAKIGKNGDNSPSPVKGVNGGGNLSPQAKKPIEGVSTPPATMGGETKSGLVVGTSPHVNNEGGHVILSDRVNEIGSNSPNPVSGKVGGGSHIPQAKKPLKGVPKPPARLSGETKVGVSGVAPEKVAPHPWGARAFFGDKPDRNLFNTEGTTTVLSELLNTMTEAEKAELNVRLNLPPPDEHVTADRLEHVLLTLKSRGLFADIVDGRFYLHSVNKQVTKYRAEFDLPILKCEIVRCALCKRDEIRRYAEAAVSALRNKGKMCHKDENNTVVVCKVTDVEYMELTNGYNKKMFSKCTGCESCAVKRKGKKQKPVTGKKKDRDTSPVKLGEVADNVILTSSWGEPENNIMSEPYLKCKKCKHVIPLDNTFYDIDSHRYTTNTHITGKSCCGTLSKKKNFMFLNIINYVLNVGGKDMPITGRIDVVSKSLGQIGTVVKCPNGHIIANQVKGDIGSLYVTKEASVGLMPSRVSDGVIVCRACLVQCGNIIRIMGDAVLKLANGVIIDGHPYKKDSSSVVSNRVACESCDNNVGRFFDMPYSILTSGSSNATSAFSAILAGTKFKITKEGGDLSSFLSIPCSTKFTGSKCYMNLFKVKEEIIPPFTLRKYAKSLLQKGHRFLCFVNTGKNLHALSRDEIVSLTTGIPVLVITNDAPFRYDALCKVHGINTAKILDTDIRGETPNISYADIVRGVSPLNAHSDDGMSDISQDDTHTSSVEHVINEGVAGADLPPPLETPKQSQEDYEVLTRYDVIYQAAASGGSYQGFVAYLKAMYFFVEISNIASQPIVTNLGLMRNIEGFNETDHGYIALQYIDYLSEEAVETFTLCAKADIEYLTYSMDFEVMYKYLQSKYTVVFYDAYRLANMFFDSVECDLESHLITSVGKYRQIRNHDAKKTRAVALRYKRYYSEDVFKLFHTYALHGEDIYVPSDIKYASIFSRPVTRVDNAIMFYSLTYNEKWKHLQSKGYDKVELPSKYVFNYQAMPILETEEFLEMAIDLLGIHFYGDTAKAVYNRNVNHGLVSEASIMRFMTSIGMSQETQAIKPLAAPLVMPKSTIFWVTLLSYFGLVEGYTPGKKVTSFIFILLAATVLCGYVTYNVTNFECIDDLKKIQLSSVEQRRLFIPFAILAASAIIGTSVALVVNNEKINNKITLLQASSADMSTKLSSLAIQTKNSINNLGTVITEHSVAISTLADDINDLRISYSPEQRAKTISYVVATNLYKNGLIDAPEFKRICYPPTLGGCSETDDMTSSCGSPDLSFYIGEYYDNSQYLGPSDYKYREYEVRVMPGFTIESESLFMPTTSILYILNRLYYTKLPLGCPGGVQRKKDRFFVKFPRGAKELFPYAVPDIEYILNNGCEDVPSVFDNIFVQTINWGVDVVANQFNVRQYKNLFFYNVDVVLNKFGMTNNALIILLLGPIKCKEENILACYNENAFVKISTETVGLNCAMPDGNNYVARVSESFEFGVSTSKIYSIYIGKKNSICFEFTPVNISGVFDQEYILPFVVVNGRRTGFCNRKLYRQRGTDLGTSDCEPEKAFNHSVSIGMTNLSHFGSECKSELRFLSKEGDYLLDEYGNKCKKLDYGTSVSYSESSKTSDSRVLSFKKPQNFVQEIVFGNNVTHKIQCTGSVALSFLPETYVDIFCLITGVIVVLMSLKYVIFGLFFLVLFLKKTNIYKKMVVVRKRKYTTDQLNVEMRVNPLNVPKDLVVDHHIDGEFHILRFTKSGKTYEVKGNSLASAYMALVKAYNA